MLGTQRSSPGSLLAPRVPACFSLQLPLPFAHLITQLVIMVQKVILKKLLNLSLYPSTSLVPLEGTGPQTILECKLITSLPAS